MVTPDDAPPGDDLLKLGWRRDKSIIDFELRAVA